MGNITYEQFIGWCKYWNYTEDEGYKAMCFVESIVCTFSGNCLNYAKEISNGTHSDAFKNLVRKREEGVANMALLYRDLNTAVFKMLEDHEKNNT